MTQPRSWLWAIPPSLLTGVWLVLAFSSGGFQEKQRLLPSLGVAFLSLVVFGLAAYPRRPSQLSMAVLLLFGAYATWVAISATWAASVDSVWSDAGRTFTYVLAVTLALMYLVSPHARSALRYMFLVAGLVLVGMAIWRLWMGGDTLLLLFGGNRFAYPASYPNNAAAMYLVLFWPMLWIACDPAERVPVRGVALGICCGLLGLAILTQSRGGAWALAITTVLTFVLSPARLRTFVYLMLPAAFVVWAFPDLNSYWIDGPAAVAGSMGARTITGGMLVAGGIGAVLALLERRVHVGRRMKVVFGAVLLLGACVGVGYGLLALERQVGDPITWLGESWAQFTAEDPTELPWASADADPSTQPSRFTTLVGSGRWEIWRVAWADFREHPWHGVGAGNFVFTFDRRDRHQTALSASREPHSIELRVLSETGAIGALLFFGAICLGLGGILWPRFSAGWSHVHRRDGGRWGNRPETYAWDVALAVGVLYWLIHGSVDWLWDMPGVTLAPLLMLALGVARADARVGVLWPRVPFNATSVWFRRVGVGAAVIVFIGLLMPFLSLRFQEIAISAHGYDDREALRAASAAAWLQPFDAKPLLARAGIYRGAAEREAAAGGTGAAAGGGQLSESAAAAAQDLALALQAHIAAVKRDPADWAHHYFTAIAAVRLRDAVVADLDRGGADGGGSLTGAAIVAPSIASEREWATAAGFLSLGPDGLTSLARSYFLEAQARNPLHPDIAAALDDLE